MENEVNNATREVILTAGCVVTTLHLDTTHANKKKQGTKTMQPEMISKEAAPGICSIGPEMETEGVGRRIKRVYQLRNLNLVKTSYN